MLNIAQLVYARESLARMKDSFTELIRLKFDILDTGVHEFSINIDLVPVLWTENVADYL